MLHKDGVKHQMLGSFGTFETAEAGDFAKVKWAFPGTLQDPIDDADADLNYEKSLPSQVELARLRSMASTPSSRSSPSPRATTSRSVRTSRPTKAISAPASCRAPGRRGQPRSRSRRELRLLVADGRRQRMPFQMRVGSEAGNTVWLIAPSVQYTGLTYADRQGILTYDAGLKFPPTRNDEIGFFLMSSRRSSRRSHWGRALTARPFYGEP